MAAPAHEQLLADIHLLRSSLLPQEFRWEGTAEDHVRWERLLEMHAAAEEGGGIDAADQDDPPPDATATMSFSVQLQEEPEVRLLVDAPLLDAGKAAEGKEIALSISSPIINASTSSSSSTQHLESLKRELDVRWKQSAEEGLENRLFDLYTHLTSYIADQPLETASPEPTSTTTNSKSTSLYKPTSLPNQSKDPASHNANINNPLRIPIFRQIFYTHHLLSPIKQKELTAWSAELGTWLLVKLGYPGFLVLEGPKYGADVVAGGSNANANAGNSGSGAMELSKRIKGMQWAKLSARTEVDWELIVEPEDLAKAGGDLEKCVLLACPLAKACLEVEEAVADEGRKGGDGWEKAKAKMMQGDKKVRSCIKKTETVKEIVDL